MVEILYLGEATYLDELKPWIPQSVTISYIPSFDEAMKCVEQITSPRVLISSKVVDDNPTSYQRLDQLVNARKGRLLLLDQGGGRLGDAPLTREERALNLLSRFGIEPIRAV